MSEDPQHPQLSLRSRKREDEADPASATPKPPDTPPPVAMGESPARFRLKPKLSPDPEPKAEADTLAVAEPSGATPIPTDAAETSSTTPKLKLKTAAPSADESSVPATPSAASPIDPSTLIGLPQGLTTSPAVPSPPLMVGALPPVVVKAPPPRPPITGFKPIAIPSPPQRPMKKRAKAGQKKMRFVIGGLVAVSILFGATVYVLLQEDAPTSAGSSAPAGVSKTQRSSAVKTDTSAEAPAVPSASRIAPLPPPPSAGPVVPRPVKIAPANSAVMAAFKAWVDDARITGVVVGESPRAIINGRLVRPGDIVDAAEGIVFDGLDTTRKEVIFRNGHGLFAGKPY